MSSTTICPWCDTEIVWDEVLGPEEECPHCHNELNAYRSMNVMIEHDEDEAEDARNEQASDANEEQPEEKGWSNFGWDDDSVLYSEPDTLRYQEGVDKVLHEQQEVPECPQCREYMLLVGKETMPSTQFTPHIPETLKQPILTAPFQLDVYVCTSCFQVSKVLAETYREPIMENVRNTKSE
ncbi:hypothetical protein LQV63_22230 [Paenibacillus profundus]|uniref:Uncharacterized protein n=1 Tax=Paenibacillus profundus TaxID=1173085 RepID=A0ABS8YLD1_9BACL|nr:MULTISPECIES: hypothetical protein [Paenibacillus]MCE5172004.1 hypothetical protein [Paenibacillus profundus]MCM3338090.1 hypothetical protein [Paenibacillus sp. MER TA 81-3]